MSWESRQGEGTGIVRLGTEANAIEEPSGLEKSRFSV